MKMHPGRRTHQYRKRRSQIEEARKKRLRKLAKAGAKPAKRVYEKKPAKVKKPKPRRERAILGRPVATIPVQGGLLSGLLGRAIKIVTGKKS